MATATNTRTYTFYSRGRMERLVRQPLHREVTSLGTQREVQSGVRYEFGPDGWLTVTEGQDMLADGPLDPATRKPTAQDAYAWLRSHELLNTRFWEEGNEPDRLQPTEEDFLDALNLNTASMQPELIREQLQQERATHNRKLLVNSAERALERIAQVEEFAAQENAGQEP